ncbi:hypothetical protein [Deinococcus radiotolerans]|uniref:DUF4397 domain-containing protein n=1 Tax=Deinococcus radiotolerans TaxID=1309407 RepID=A0ABQ2FNA0_9DEIO|nr:hypothetical protein [Deinococcus radiotolerans]GGL10861.1 hypothetical protein GCM10010844_31920 [Deinococcus radiotolerans]
MRRTVSALACPSLALLLASCGHSTATPTASPLTELRLSATGFMVGAAPQDLGGLGLTSDAPARHVVVTVRDDSGQVVTFNGTTYDPTGTGAATVELNSGNLFRRTLLLPSGTYTFENAVKDDATNATLLAYGPAAENAGTLTTTGGSVRLTAHAVMDPASSVLAPTENVPQLFTDSTVNLALSPKTAGVNGASATVPTSDISAVTYSLGSPTDGVLNGAGSKVGVNVTARGAADDTTLNVTASFSAWIRVAGTDTATFQSVSVSYAQGIAMYAVVQQAAPLMGFAPISGPPLNRG